jgi:outer membrane protein
MSMSKTGLMGRAAALALALAAPGVQAETLKEALAAAYASNPDLTIQRSVVRQLDETVEQASAAGRPTVAGSVSVSQDSNGFATANNDGRSLVAGATLSLPIFTSGRISNNVRAADQRVAAGRQDLLTTENQVFLNVTAAYMDVLRDQSVVELNQNQVRVLEEQLRASRDRFEVGDLTRTDVAQSEARLAIARANLAAAQGQLQFSREAYRRQVGRAPGSLEPPPPLPTLPGTPGQAVDLAVANNPALKAARAIEQAARYDVAAQRAGNLPSVSGSTSVRQTDRLGTNVVIPGLVNTPENFGATTFGVTMSVPLFQAGQVSSRVRQAQARQSQALEQIASTERLVVANARNAYEALVTARATIESAQAAVTANELALEGNRQENLVGSRTILDVLDAEQELLNARVSLVRARRDEYVASFQLLAATGQARSDVLELPVERYDPEANYKRVRHSWWDWRDAPKPKAVAPGPDLSDVPGRSN